MVETEPRPRLLSAELPQYFVTPHPPPYFFGDITEVIYIIYNSRDTEIALF